jgi:hypothetical protein
MPRGGLFRAVTIESTGGQRSGQPALTRGLLDCRARLAIYQIASHDRLPPTPPAAGTQVVSADAWLSRYEPGSSGA